LEKYKAPTSTVIRHGDTIYSAVRTRHGRDLHRSKRTPDRARAGTVEALCRDGGIIPGENILKVNVYVTSVEMFPAVNEVYRR
jgi:2-iminobutanoate/2-iminopropanoate deaminase